MQLLEIIKIKRLASLVFLCLICLLLAGCPARQTGGKVQNSQGSYTVTDDSGYTMTLAAKPQRIASLSYGTDEMLVELVAMDRILAFSRWADDPEITFITAGQAAQVKKRALPYAEALIALRPDLIVAAASTLRPEAVEKVEVIRGAGSTLYGSEALAGVVNIITKKPGSSQQNSIGITGGNYNQNWSVSSEFGNSAIYLKREYIAAVDRTSRDNLTAKKDDKPVQPYGLDKGTKDSFYFTTQLSDELNFNWSYTDLQSNRPRYNTDGSRYMLYKYDDVRNNLNLSYDNKDDNFKSVLSFNKRHAFGDKYDYKTGGWGISERYNMYGINWDNQKAWKLRDDRDTLIAGVTLAREHYNGLPGSTAVKYNNALRNSFAVYGAYTYNINPEFSTTLGLRENVIKDYATDKNVFLPQIQTLYKINDNTSWYTNIGKSFQMPALNQYFSKQSTDFNRLKPQQGWNYETGIKIIDNNQSFKAALYHMDIKDQFVWKKNPDKTDYMANAGNFRNTGMELEYVKILNNNWKYNLGFSYSNPENNENGSWEQCNSRIQTTAGITYNQEKWLTNVNFLFLGDREESYYKINGNISDIPDRVQLNAIIRYQPERNQSVILNLYNILDRNNSVNKYENLDLPFNWALSYNYTF